ncbi:7878_t:CDS:2 [Dentiscutata erythropus]|uniref:7878_t:CDS:1 n=1 Tax=Dentiscutata erythropus TaxID=1348616 RepID=A0A9N8W524_9GLOM|nr:7878_t:CDS:2 [Dentiscutata erythropus]
MNILQYATNSISIEDGERLETLNRFGTGNTLKKRKDEKVKEEVKNEEPKKKVKDENEKEILLKTI